ncbi:hypothetical protein [Polluticaenibacter yanchengensis]|uniref:T9SS C-terminal target domain-containing protein n=1 Tax=Polluticaenibacter yanchengensis TaxID=3014562 RepID=A0ABT4UFI1_9BACT|nr:hypothetical protein [Chitinophagaceae bacterium LY-5]
MKFNFFKNSMLVGLLSLSLVACDKNDDVVDGGGTNGYVTLKGEIETQTLTADKKYLLSGQVFVRGGKTLTIEPGTVIAGEKKSKGTLVIDKNAKLVANGTKEKPIIFTSNQELGDRDRGDWGGIVLLGNAKVNLTNPSVEGIEPAVTYGGTNDADNSGSLTFVRVEFAGIELTPNNETNGITLAGVGNGTKFENIQVTYGGDDGIEWFGGSVNGKYLIVFGTWDDDFDIDNGFSGNLQFGLGVRYPSYADQSDSNGFEWDTNGTNDATDLPTTATVSNFTMLGPSIDGNSFNANYKHGMDLRRRVSASLFNSVIVGYPTAVRMNQNTVYPNYSSNAAQIANNIFYAKTTTVLSGSTDITAAQILTYLTSNDNVVEAGTDKQTTAAYTALGLKAEQFFNKRLNDAYTTPNFAVTTGTLATGAKFTYAKFSEANRTAQFDKTVTFRGAFGATDWTLGWTNFNPINTKY